MKTPPQMPSDATIATLVDRLSNPEEYVRRIFATMRECRYDQVRIGIYSNPAHPDYIFDEFFKDDDDPLPGQAVPMDAYNGRTHRQTSFNKFDNWKQWSRAGMSQKEIQQLLGNIRGFTVKPAKR